MYVGANVQASSRRPTKKSDIANLLKKAKQEKDDNELFRVAGPDLLKQMQNEAVQRAELQSQRVEIQYFKPRFANENDQDPVPKPVT